jgi:hypothetical protein
MKAYKPFTSLVSTITPTVLGYRLLPFSLGMSINLKEGKSKFITGEYNGLCDINKVFLALKHDKTLIAEFIFAVLTCSNTYDEVKEEYANGEMVKEYQKLMKRLLKKPRKGNTKNQNKLWKPNLLYEIHRFCHYIKDGTDTLAYAIKNKKETEIQSNPFEFEESVISTLLETTNYTRDECYNLPMTETQNAYLIRQHKNDVIVIIDKKTSELMELMKGGNT